MKTIKNNGKSQKQKKSRVVARIVILVAILAIIFVFASGAFEISEITVEGNKNVSDEQIISLSQIQKGKNLFAVSKKEIINNIKENAYIDQVKVNRCLPNEIKLVITERQVKYIAELASGYVYIDNQGYILEIATQPIDVLILSGLDIDINNVKVNNKLNENDINKLKIVEKIISIATGNNINDLITKIDVSNEEDFVIYMDSKNKIAYIGDGTDLNIRFLYVKKILEEQEGKSGEIFVDMDLNSEYAYFSENI